jgi:hypothetical protein
MSGSRDSRDLKDSKDEKSWRALVLAVLEVTAVLPRPFISPARLPLRSFYETEPEFPQL